MDNPNELYMYNFLNNAFAKGEHNEKYKEVMKELKQVMNFETLVIECQSVKLEEWPSGIQPQNSVFLKKKINYIM